MSPADALRECAAMVAGGKVARDLSAAANRVEHKLDSPGYAAHQLKWWLKDDCVWHVSPDERAALDLAIEALS